MLNFSPGFFLSSFRFLIFQISNLRSDCSTSIVMLVRHLGAEWGKPQKSSYMSPFDAIGPFAHESIFLVGSHKRPPDSPHPCISSITRFSISPNRRDNNPVAGLLWPLPSCGYGKYIHLIAKIQSYILRCLQFDHQKNTSFIGVKKIQVPRSCFRSNCTFFLSFSFSIF